MAKFHRFSFSFENDLTSSYHLHNSPKITRKLMFTLSFFNMLYDYRRSTVFYQQKIVLMSKSLIRSNIDFTLIFIRKFTQVGGMMFILNVNFLLSHKFLFM